MFVAPASKLFSTNSLIAVCRSTKTCPEDIRWTELLSMDLIIEEAERNAQEEIKAVNCFRVTLCDRRV